MWGIQIIDFESGDKLLVKISNIFGDDYGEFIQDESLSFQVLQLSQSDTLNFEIENIGTRNANIVVMFSEDPKNSEIFSQPNSTTMSLPPPLAISRLLLILGITISLIGLVVLLLDLKNNQNNKRNY